MTDWFRITNEGGVPSPALLLYSDRIEENLRRMIALAGGADRLRAHVKTQKLPQVIALKLRAGITKFKTATIAEAEMTAAAGGRDVLLAYQPVGPGIRRFVELVKTFPQTHFTGLVDNPGTVGELRRAAQSAGVTLDFYLDLNAGMNRTGIAPGDRAAAVYRALATPPGLRAAGLHAYDGRLPNGGVAQRGVGRARWSRGGLHNDETSQATLCSKAYESAREARSIGGHGGWFSVSSEPLCSTLSRNHSVEQNARLHPGPAAVELSV